MQHPKIIVLGSVNADLVVSSAQLPTAGETVIGDSFTRRMAAKERTRPSPLLEHPGQPVGFIAAVGNDDFGKGAIRQLRSENISTQHIRMVDDSRRVLH